MTQTTHGPDPHSATPEPQAEPVALCHLACPVCNAEISHYQAYCEAQEIPVTWVDISTGQNAQILQKLGLDREDAKRRMTVLAADGVLYRGIDAFLILWRRMPRYRWLAWLISLPGVYTVACGVYDHILAPLLYRWNVTRGR